MLCKIAEEERIQARCCVVAVSNISNDGSVPKTNGGVRVTVVTVSNTRGWRERTDKRRGKAKIVAVSNTCNDGRVEGDWVKGGEPERRQVKMSGGVE